MGIANNIRTIKSFFAEIIGEECRVLSLSKIEDGWKSICEVTVDEEYTRRKGLGDIVELYEVMMNENGDIKEYELKTTKRKASLE